MKHLTKVTYYACTSSSLLFLFLLHINESFLAFVHHQSGVRLVRGVVKEVHPRKIILGDGSEVPYGLLVWSTGVGPSDFVKSLDLPKSPGGRYYYYCISSLIFI